MVDKKDGGPAFPRLATDRFVESQNGMSLRQWYAGMALAGGGGRDQIGTKPYDDTAAYCFAVADAMIAEDER